ncbi:hypothetical protein Acr_04g0003910 [Actinidia rufa]|uniref:Uncharacterized protein n=1 Tax=Actinidia rufa TaxID=165716 RepID=A0A7J0EGQ2_9ERIC|nr:hypothetical protein Acr_04g0003910 [Actinidia rufa]
MANKLASLLKEKEKPTTRGRSCLKNLGEVVSENDSDGINRQTKKVRFSPENEMFEFEGSRADYVETKRGKRRKSIIRPVAKKGGLVTDNVEASWEIMENPVRTTRFQARKSLSGGIIPVDLPRVVKKRTRNVERSDSLEVRYGARGDHLASALEDTMVTTRRSLRRREVISEKSKEVEEDVAVLRKNQRVRSSKKKNVGTGDEIPKDSGLRGLGENEMARKGRTTQSLDLWTDNASELEREMQIETKVKALGKLEVVLQLEEPSKQNEKKVKDHAILNGDLVVNERARRGRTTRSQTLVPDNASAPKRKVSTETEVEAFGKLEVVLQLVKPSRRKGRNGNRRQSIMPQIEKLGTDGANLRSRRGDVIDETANNTAKNKPLKRRRKTITEETVVTEAAAFAEEPHRRSTRIAAQTDEATLAIETDKAVGREKMQSRSKHPNPELEPLAKSTLVIKEPPALNAEVSMQENAGSSITTVLNSGEVPNESANKNKKRFLEKFLSTKVSVETGDIEEAKALDMVNSVVNPASESVKLQTDHAEEAPLFSVSDAGADKEESSEDDTSRVNEDDLASHTGKRSRESSSSHSFEPEPEPEEDLNVSADVGSPQATSVDDGCSLVDRTDCEDNLDVGKEIEGDEELDSPKHIDSSLVVAHHEVDDGKASILKKLKVVELEDSDSVGEPIKQEFVVEDHLAKSNESRGSKKNSENVSDEVGELSVLDISDEERIRSTQVKDKKTDDAEICAVGAEEQESAICSFRTQNITMGTLLTENLSASKGLAVTNPGSSELEVADGTSNPALRSRKKVSEDTNWKTKGSGRNSSLNKHHLMKACTESRDADEIRGLTMVNLHGTPASSSVRLQSGSVEKERNILASESLVVPEKQNIVLVASNQNLFLGDMHKGTAKVLVSPSQIKSGDFEEKDKVGSVVFTGTCFGADGFSPVPQAEHVAKPSSYLAFGDHLESEELSCKYTQSRGITEADYASENDKCSVLEGQTFIEFQEVCRFSEPSTHDRVCESHSTELSESEGTGEACENTSVNAVDIRVLDPSHGERITPNMVEQKNEEVELLEKNSLSNVVTAKVVSKKTIDFQIASGGYLGTLLTPLNAVGCQGSPIGVEVTNSAGPAISIVNETQGTRSNSNDSVNAQVIQSAIVTEAKHNGESIRGDLHLEDSELNSEEENVECLPGLEFGDSRDCKDQVHGSGDASLAETMCKESEVSEEKITTEFIKSTSECSNETDLLEGEKGTLSPFDQLGISKIVLADGIESSIMDSNDLEASDMSNKDAKENVIPAISEADFDHRESGIVFMEDTYTINLEHGEMNRNDSNVDKDEVVTELETSTSTVLEKLTNKQGDENLVEVANKFDGALTQVDEVLSNDFAGHDIEMVQELEKGSFVSHEIVSVDNEHSDDETSVDAAVTKLQVEEIKLDDLDRHKDGARVEENLNLVDNNSYAKDDVSQGYFDSCSDHEKVPQKAKSNVSESDGKDSESHIHHGDINSDADGREVTGVEQDDLFDNCGFTVSSLVSTDCNKKRGSTTTSMNESFPEDKDVGVGVITSGMIDNISSCTAEGPSIKVNAKNKEKISEEESVDDEDTFVDGSDGLAFNLFCGNETESISETDEVHGLWHDHNDTVHTHGETKEYTELQNFRGTMGYGTAELSLEYNMFSSWEIDMFLGDEVMNSTSEIPETHFTIVPEDQFDKHNQPMEAGKVAETNSTCFTSNGSVFEGDEALNEAKEMTNKSDCKYSENYLVEVEKSSIPMHDEILTEVSNPKGSDLSASVDLRVESGFKSSEEERVGDENALKSNPATEVQSSQLIDLATTDRDELLNSTTKKRKNAETNRIQGTPMHLVTTLDMKENVPNIKRQNLDTTTVKSTTKRRALEELRKQ